MNQNPFSVGDRVLASRAQDGANHEEGTVVDAHLLLIGEITRPIAVVEFADGVRVYCTAAAPDVLPLPEPEEEPEAAEETQAES